MAQETTGTLKRPRVTDEGMRNITSALMGFPAILVAHELRLFEFLAPGPRSVDEVVQKLRLRPRAAETILDVATAAGFLSCQDRRYGLTPLAEDYMLEASPTYWGHYLDYVIQSDLYSLTSIRKALTGPEPKHSGGTEIFDTHEEDDRKAEQFTRWMHSLSMAPALAWPSEIDLGAHKHMIDVAGGSGAHTIGALGRWPHLRSTLLDRPAVLGVAREMIAAHGLTERSHTLGFDMWKDPFPEGDVHFYSQIFHDWNLERCGVLAAKSFAALPSGGRIIVHELLPNEDGTGPFRVVAVNVVLCLLYSGGRQHGIGDLRRTLESAGFRDIEVKRTFDEWGIVTGRKP
jgi:hypothetical protein